jgi:hypothetical protein
MSTEMDILSYDILSDILNGKRLAVRIPKFYDLERCRSLRSSIRTLIKESRARSGGLYKSNAIPFWNAIKCVELKDRYFNTALSLMQELRNLSSPYLSPIDLLRLVLDETWPNGASLMRLEGKVMLFGIARMWPESFEALPHQDLLRREIPHSNEVKDQVSQLGANIYLKTARVGGELEIWDYSFSDEDCLKYGVEGSYGFDRSLLSANSLILKPEEGDLIILNTTKVHAIRKVLQGERMTISGFIGFWGNDRPLKCWS